MAIIILKHSSLLSADEKKMLFLKLEEIERFLNGREEQCNLPHFQIAHDHEHEFVTTDLVKRNESGFTDNEIDSMIKDLAMCKVKGLGSAAAFAASALKTEADKSAKHSSWCPKYEDQIIAPIKKDFKKAISSWPFWLRMLIENFESLEFGVDDVHQILFDFAVPKLRALMSKVSDVMMQGRIMGMLTAIATFKDRFPHDQISGVAYMLLQFAMAILFAYCCYTVAPYTEALRFCANVGVALMVSVVGVGLWRSSSDVFVKMASGAMIGAGASILMIGLATAPVAAGALLGAGIAGFAGLYFRES